MKKFGYSGKTWIGLVAACGLVAILVTAAISSSQAADPRTIPSSAGPALAKTRFASGEVNDYIVQTFLPNPISLHRGESATVEVKLEHKTNGNGQDVVLTSFQNTVRNFAPSARANLSDEEFDDLVANNPTSLLRGEVPNQGIMTITPAAVTLPPDTSKTITMTVFLPKNISDEIVGKTIYVGANFDIIPQDPNVVGTFDTLVIEVLS